MRAYNCGCVLTSLSVSFPFFFTFGVFLSSLRNFTTLEAPPQCNSLLTSFHSLCFNIVIPSAQNFVDVTNNCSLKILKHYYNHSGTSDDADDTTEQVVMPKLNGRLITC
ncbi:hypothetical protein GmHk_17G048134 [Glycine max]|nr:hypothetical protein GmHk_17G048134 [Glycine max]